MRTLRLVTVCIISLASMGFAAAGDYLCRDVGAGWAWFSDHVALSDEYLVVGQPGRRYETGTGMMIAGVPRGWRSKHSGSVKVTAWGAGALHIRKDDDGPPFKVCVGPGKLTPISILSVEF